jgi:hypothetical protein
MSVTIACSASRRDFLRSATAAAGAVALGTAQSAGAEPNPGKPSGPASAAPHRSFTSFCGRVEDGRVILSAFKAVRYTADSAKGEFATIRVYRRPVDFVWCTDYDEFFNGLAPDKDDLIFKGPIEAVNKDKFTYVDAKAAEGKTYAYFIASASENIPPTGPVPIMVRDPEAWWPYEKVVERMQRMAQLYPGLARVQEIGKTSRTHPLHAIQIGNGGPVIGLLGAVHAGEIGPELIVPALENLLEHHKDVFERVRLLAIPSVNWEERDRQVHGVPWYLRVNSNGVDLNRNFAADWEQVNYAYGRLTSDPDSETYRGPKPASEQETQAIVKLFEAHPPAVTYSFHGTGNSLLAAQLSEKDPAYVGKLKRWSQIYGGGCEGRKPVTTSLYFGATAGSLSAWIYRRFGAPAFDVEGGGMGPQQHSAGILAVAQALAGTEKRS